MNNGISIGKPNGILLHQLIQLFKSLSMQSITLRLKGKSVRKIVISKKQVVHRLLPKRMRQAKGCRYLPSGLINQGIQPRCELLAIVNLGAGKISHELEKKMFITPILRF